MYSSKQLKHVCITTYADYKLYVIKMRLSSAKLSFLCLGYCSQELRTLRDRKMWCNRIGYGRRERYIFAIVIVLIYSKWINGPWNKLKNKVWCWKWLWEAIRNRVDSNFHSRPVDHKWHIASMNHYLVDR